MKQRVPVDTAETTDELRGMARGGGLNLAGAVCQQLVLLGITLVIAHRLGRTDVGLYAQAIAFLMVLQTLSLSGLFAGLRRFVAVHAAERDMRALRGTTRLGLGLSAVASSLLGLGLYVSAPWLAHGVFHDPQLATPLRFVAVALPFATFTQAALAATQGFRTMKPSVVIGSVFEPSMRIVLTCLLLPSMGLTGAMVGLLTSNAVAACLAAAALRRQIGTHRERPTYALRELLGFSMVNWLSTLAATGLLWADTLLLGVFLTSAEVGLYSVATRLVTLATFMMPAINNAFAPRIADLHHRNRLESLRRTYQVATGWNVRLTVPIFAMLVVFPDDLLTLFGRAFTTAAAVTVILAIGKFTVVVTGPCGLMLDMSGRPVWSMADNIAGFVTNILLNLWWIPRYGIVGSAAAWAVSLLLVNLARVVQVWRIMGMSPFDAGVVKGAAAGAGALLTGLVVDQWLDPPHGFVVGVVALALAYVGLVLLLGITPEDRLVLGMLGRRFGWRSGAHAKGRGSRTEATSNSRQPAPVDHADS
jgi:O-antigen/teichoic acid export membrane protein